VMAAQSIGEPGTQLTMRTFHIGGAAQRGAEESAIEASMDGTLKIEHRNVVEDSRGRAVVMGRNTELLIEDENGRERARFPVPYGSRLFKDDGETVAKGEKLAEWDPYTVPILTERDGKVQYADLVDGLSVTEQLDEATGIASKVVADWRSSAKGHDLKPRMVLTDEKGEPVTLASGHEAAYFMQPGAILSVEAGTEVKAGDVLARIPRESQGTRDITGGLPRVAELFEARRPKDFAILAEVAGQIRFGKDYKTKRRVIIDTEEGETSEYLLPKGRNLAVREGDWVNRGDKLVEGSPVPHDILRVLGVEELANYLINEIQDVYRLQGVKIDDKHIEVVVRQMLQKVEITDPGETTLLIGEQIDRMELEEINARAEAESLVPAKAEPVLLGITKASLQTRSFISAASFQETTRVLTDAAVNGKIDRLEGLKENVIVGRLIPAGTGSVTKDYKRIASERDRETMARMQEGDEGEEAEALPAADAEESSVA